MQYCLVDPRSERQLVEPNVLQSGTELNKTKSGPEFNKTSRNSEQSGEEWIRERSGTEWSQDPAGFRGLEPRYPGGVFRETCFQSSSPCRSNIVFDDIGKTEKINIYFTHYSSSRQLNSLKSAKHNFLLDGHKNIKKTIKSISRIHRRA